MAIERILSPSYHVAVLELQKFEPDEIVESFKRRGAHITLLSKELDPELEIESFMSSSYGGYVYLLKFKEKTFLARHKEPVDEKDWKSPKKFIARDENGLKRLILSRISWKERLLLELPPFIIWASVIFEIMKRVWDNPLISFAWIFVGFVLNEVAKLLEYLLLGYCEG